MIPALATGKSQIHLQPGWILWRDSICFFMGSSFNDLRQIEQSDILPFLAVFEQLCRESGARAQGKTAVALCQQLYSKLLE